MKTVRRLLQGKTKGVYSISPGSVVDDALKLMVEKDVGALVVLDGHTLVGIVTERDVARKVTLAGLSSATTVVGTVMTERVLYVRPDQTVEECMALMTERHLRHLPVIEEGHVIGLVSIRDIVADIIAEKSFMIEQLEHYIYAIPPYERATSAA